MLFLELVGWWIALSCALGPALTWLFFYGARRERKARRRPIRRAITYTPVPQLIYARGSRSDEVRLQAGRRRG